MREPVPEARPSRDSAPVPAPAPTPLAPHQLLALQRSAGNQAVARAVALARNWGDAPAPPPKPFYDPGPFEPPKPPQPFGQPSQPAPERQPAGSAPPSSPAPPDWFRLSSSQGVLPGEPVPGLTDAGRPLTAEDRALLERHLSARLKHNGVNAARFVTAFDAAARQVWTSFVVEQMNEAFDDATWSTLTKMLSFAIRGAIIVFMPWEGLAEVLGEAVAGAMEKAFEFEFESAAEEIQHHGQESSVKGRGAQLIKLGETISKAVGPSLAKALTPLSQGEFYRDWLTRAPLSELTKFRVPYAIPTADEGRLRTALADLMGGFAHAQKPKSDDNQIAVEVTATESGVVGQPRALFSGSETFGRELKGHPVRTIRHVPIKVRVKGGIPMYTLLGYTRSQEISDLENAYPGVGLVITISDGQITTLGQGDEPNGGLEAHLYMARVANPGLDLVGLLKRYEEKMSRMISPQYTPKRAAADLHRELRPLVLNGMKAFIRDEVDPLWVVTDDH